MRDERARSTKASLEIHRPVQAYDAVSAAKRLREEKTYEDHGRSVLSLFHGPSLRAMLTTIATGRRTGERRVASSSTVHVLEGEVKFRAGEERHVLSAGGMLVLEGNVPFEAEALSEAAFLHTLVLPGHDTSLPQPVHPTEPAEGGADLDLPGADQPPKSYEKLAEEQEGHLGRRRKGREMNTRRTVNGTEDAKSLFPTKILLATDGSADAVQATEAAVDLADKSGSQLHVVHVWQDVPTPYAHAFVKQELERQGQEILEEQVWRIDADGGAVAGAHLKMGRTSDEVIELGEELGADLIVVGSRGLGPVKRVLLGSRSEEIVHHAHVPVLVLRRGEDVWPPARVVIGDDFSEDAKKAGELAANIAKLYGADVLLLHAFPHLLEESPGPEADYALRRAEERLEERAGSLEIILGHRPRTRMVAGDPAEAVLEATRGDKPALVAVGSRGLGMVGRVSLGSVSTKIVTAAPGPVLVFPHTE
jgi:nucleotide-binding universal stress UspA family protein/quercetin dioxygenase-like cupin family protein